MPLDPALAGRRITSARSYDVSRAKVAEFATAVGATDPAHYDREAALAEGFPDVAAPQTFPIVVAFSAIGDLLSEPGSGLALHRVVHADQRFVHERPVHAGDDLTATLTVESVRRAAGSDVVSTRTEIDTTTGEHVCTAYATLVHRDEETPA